MVAAGHYGGKSPHLVKHYAEDLEYEYLSENCKEEFLSYVERFTYYQISDRPMLFEVFTETQGESDALEMILNMNDKSVNVKNKIKSKVKEIIKDNIDSRKIEGFKMILGR